MRQLLVPQSCSGIPARMSCLGVCPGPSSPCGNSLTDSLSQPGGAEGHTSRRSTCVTLTHSSALAFSILELNPCSISSILLNFPTLERNGAEEIL